MNEPLTHLVPLSSHYTILYVEDDSDTQKEVYVACDGE
jgi:hypothetical protein